MLDDARVRRALDEIPVDALFVTVSGAHLYGFESADSDVDLRACHLAAWEDVAGLFPEKETFERSWMIERLEIDCVSHEAAKFFRMLLKPNGYVLEQLTSPLVLHSTPSHQALNDLVPRLLTWRHAHHYLGLAGSQLKLFERDDPPRPKPLLYVYRALLTGLHLMTTGELNAHLPTLAERRREPGLQSLLQLKRSSGEKEARSIPGLRDHRARISELIRELEAARDARPLPDEPSAGEELNQLLLDLRRRSAGSAPS